MPRLHRVDPSGPGLTRRRRGTGFSYEDARGLPVRDGAVLERIRGLAIPPAWTDVWICADPQGHLQAVGVDAAGRRQYLYHPIWRERQDVSKFRRVESFARALPDLRERIERDLGLDGAPKERVMAAAVRLLDRATFRIGSEEYADRHGSFGLATIRKSHVHVEGSTLTFDYVAKAGVRQVHRIDDPLLAPVVEQLKRRRSGGLELLAYRKEQRWRDVRSTDINAYLKDLLGEEHSAKDFRTWHATVLAAIDIARVSGADGHSAAAKRSVADTVRRVADHLGNTPAVCRTSYIDPRVFDRFREGRTVGPALRQIPADDEQAREAVERAVLDLLGNDEGEALAA
ncbi:MAG: DNA topoisomerase IB [Actinomycetota bacterium]